MTLPEDYQALLVRATGLAPDQMPADPSDRLAAVLAAQVLEARLARGVKPSAAAPLSSEQLAEFAEIVREAKPRFGGTVWTVAQLVRGTEADSTDKSVRIGKTLGSAARAMTVVDGFRVEAFGESHRTKRWRLRAVG